MLSTSGTCPALADSVVRELGEGFQKPASMFQMPDRVARWRASFESPLAEFLDPESAQAEIQVLMPPEGMAL
jgi:hypothetical protein